MAEPTPDDLSSPLQVPLVPFPDRDRPDAPLPTPRTSFVGREQEVTQVRALLLRADVPLVTLTGPGGVGKTRLALAVAHDVAAAFADGAIFVDLSPVSDPDLVLPTVAIALDVRATGARPLPEILAAVLRPRQLLLLLDNCEHVLSIAPEIAALLAACPALQVLATSRAPLHLRGEHEFPVSPLPLPAGATAPAAAVARVDAVALFLQRARAAAPGFAPTDDDLGTIAACCRRLDGLPLAIELAAARLKVLSPASLLAGLSDRLRLLTGGARDLPARQRTLRDVIAWSVDLLAPDERRLFGRLAVFAGGFDLAAATAVDGDDALAVVERITALVDQSLLQRGDRRGGQAAASPRFSMLETVREFARERLREQAEETEARRAHAAHFLALVEQAEAEMYGPAMRRWLDLLEDEHANIRAALDTFAELGDPTAELRLAGPMIEFWWQRGHPREGMERLEGALERGRTAPPGPRAKVAAWLAAVYGEFDNTAAGLELSTRALAWAREAGDDALVALALGTRMSIVRWSGNADDLATEIESLQEVVDLLAGLRLSPWARSFESIALGDLGEAVARRGDRFRGLALVEQALSLARALGEPFATGIHLAQLGVMAQRAGNIAPAAALFAESVHSFWDLGETMTIAWPLRHLAALAAARGLCEQAARLLGAVAAVQQRTGTAIQAVSRPDDLQADVTARAGLGDAAYEAAVAIGRRLPPADAVAEALALADTLVRNTDAPATPAPPPPLPPTPRPTDP